MGVHFQDQDDWIPDLTNQLINAVVDASLRQGLRPHVTQSAMAVVV